MNEHDILALSKENTLGNFSSNIPYLGSLLADHWLGTPSRSKHWLLAVVIMPGHKLRVHYDDR